MAGDWIKLEHSTLDKPEVLRTAEMLGVSRDSAIGVFVRYFVWLDRNLSGSCPDVVRNVSRKSLDDVLGCAGFAACLQSVGWAEIDENAWALRVINAERHNGNTAKSRALDARRKRKSRPVSVLETSGHGPDENRTREEKRRVTTTSSLRSDVVVPSPEHRALAKRLAVDCDAEYAKYADWLLANGGRRHKDRAAGFRNWLRKAAEFRRGSSRHDGKGAVASAIFGGTNEQRHNDDQIDGVAERVA